MLRLPTVVTAVQAPALLGDLSRGLCDAPEQTLIELDASAVAQLDSSCVALLLALRRRANARGQDLRVQGASASMQALIRAYGLESLLMEAALATTH